MTMAMAEPWTRPAVSRREITSDSHMTAPTTAKAATRLCSMKTCSIMCNMGLGLLGGWDGAVGHSWFPSRWGASEIGGRIARDDVAAAFNLGDFFGRKFALLSEAADQGHA